MGTVFDQPARNSLTYDNKDVLNFVEEIKRISKETNLSFDQILRVYEIEEMQRRNNLSVIDDDIKMNK